MAGEQYHDIQQTHLYWTVFKNGYQWLDKPGKLFSARVMDGRVQACTEKPPVLYPLPGPDGKIDRFNGAKGYYPFEDQPTLFQEFANLEPTKEDTIAFADKYGCITAAVNFNDKDIIGPPINTDSFGTWVTEIAEIKRVLDLWLAALAAGGKDTGSIGITKTQANELLSEFIMKHRTPKGGEYYLYKADSPRFAGAFPADKRNVAAAAEYFVCTFLGRKLSELRVAPAFVWNKDNEHFPRLIPENLLGAMWLQFYLWVAGDKTYKRCPVCGYWADTTGHRSDWKEHPECGVRRRSRESYERKKAAASKRKKGSS